MWPASVVVPEPEPAPFVVPASLPPEPKPETDAFDEPHAAKSSKGRTPRA